MTNYEDHVLTGGDDGRFLKISSDGNIDEIFNFGSKWVDCVASHKDTKVCSSGKTVYIWTKNTDIDSKIRLSTIPSGLQSCGSRENPYGEGGCNTLPPTGTSYYWKIWVHFKWYI